MKILLVEDDEVIAKVLSEELSSWGYETMQVQEFDRVLEVFQNVQPELVLMDVMLPSGNGFYWCQKIREISKTPIIFISSRSERMDIIQAIQFGADDYIVKPIDIAVTRAKIQALLRRTYDFTGHMDVVFFDGLCLNLTEAKLSFQEAVAELTRTELIITEALLRAKGGIVSRESLMERCWQGDHYIDDNTLAVNMTRLRKKFEEIGQKGKIGTKRGIGYYLMTENGE